MSPEPTPRRAIRIVSQCATKEDFIAVFHPYLERDALFVATSSPEEAGARLHFVMTLAGGEAVLRGAGVVVESHRSKSNFYGLRGMKLRFDELDLQSRSALRAVEAGPRRHSSAPPAPGRGPNEMVECLIYEDPGTEPPEPLVHGSDGMVEQSDPGNLPPLSADDDVTAVAPPPRRPGDGEKADEANADGPVPNGPTRGMAGFVVPRPRSDPSIAINPGGVRVEMAQPDTEKLAPLAPMDAEQASAGELVPEPPRLPAADELPPVRSRRGKGTGQSAATEMPPAPAPAPLPETGPPDPADGMADLATLATMRLPAADVRRGMQVPPGRFRHESSPPDHHHPDFTPPPGMSPPQVDPLSITGSGPMLPMRQPAAPRRPMGPAAVITPTEIVSPLALERRTEKRRSRGPMASERTDVVRVSYVRTAAVSATLGALLGLGAGYLLWGLERETQPALMVAPENDAGTRATAPAPRDPSEQQPGSSADAGAATVDAAPAPGAAPPRTAPPRTAPARKPATPARRRRR